MQLIDSHSHLDFSEFDSDRTTAIQRANDAGVSNIIVSATTAKRWPLIKQLCNMPCDIQTQCHPAYGLHPMFMDEHKNQAILAKQIDKMSLFITNLFCYYNII